jgi:hypothetical protein
MELVREYMEETSPFTFKINLLLYLIATDKAFKRNIPSDLKKAPRHKIEYLNSLKHELMHHRISVYETFKRLGLFRE